MADYETHRVRRRRRRRRRGGAAGGDRGRRAGRAHGARLQVAARQGPHRDGRGRDRRRPRQRVPRGQLAGALPRHDARRQVAQQLADGPDPRPGGSRAGARARGVGRAVRPHARRAHPPARLRRPPVRPAGPRRRPHRARDDPHAPAPRGPGGDRRCSWSARSPGCSRTASASPARSATGGSRAASSSSRRPPSCSRPAASARPTRSRRTRGSTPATATRSRCGPAPISSTWSSCSSTRPAWCGRRRCAASSSPRASAATAGCCATPTASGSCSATSPRCSAPRPPTPRRRPTAGTTTRRVRRTPDLLPRDEVARAINAEIKEGRGSPHGGVFLDIASRRDADYITRRLPGMYHQFRELADVDITKEPMEVGPTCHYMMGGVRVDAETQASTVPGLFAAGEVAAGLHGANRLGRQLAVGPARVRPAGRAVRRGVRTACRRPTAAWTTASSTTLAARRCARSTPPGRRTRTPSSRTCRSACRRWSASSAPRTSSPRRSRSSPALRDRAARVRRRGPPAVQPRLAPRARPRSAARGVGVHHARRARSARESRGAQTRDDYPGTDPELAKVNVVVRAARRRAVACPRAPLPDECPERPR